MLVSLIASIAFHMYKMQPFLNKSVDYSDVTNSSPIYIRQCSTEHAGIRKPQSVGKLVLPPQFGQYCVKTFVTRIFVHSMNVVKQFVIKTLFILKPIKCPRHNCVRVTLATGLVASKAYEKEHIVALLWG